MIEGQRRVARNSKRMEGKSKGRRTTQIMTTNYGDIITEYTHKELIEIIITQGNDKIVIKQRGGIKL